MMDLSVIMPWVVAAMTIINFVSLLKGMLSTGEKALGEEVSASKKTLIDHDRRIQALEGELKHLPDKDTVTDLKIALAELRGIVATMGETVGSVSRTVHRIDDYLREREKA